jgi:hypothetical protein
MAVNKNTRNTRPDWDEIAKLDPDDIPLSNEEQRQLNSESGFVSWEKAMNELELPTDTKS